MKIETSNWIMSVLFHCCVSRTPGVTGHEAPPSAAPEANWI